MATKGYQPIADDSTSTKPNRYSVYTIVDDPPNHALAQQHTNYNWFQRDSQDHNNLNKENNNLYTYQQRNKMGTPTTNTTSNMLVYQDQQDGLEYPYLSNKNQHQPSQQTAAAHFNYHNALPPPQPYLSNANINGPTTRIGYQVLPDHKSTNTKGAAAALRSSHSQPWADAEVDTETANEQYHDPAPYSNNSNNLTTVQQADTVGVQSPQVQFYTDPIDPTQDISFVDRVFLIKNSARPWREFFNPQAFNIPESSEFRLRYFHNLETYFYNYILITLFYTLLFVFAHPFTVFEILLVLAVPTFMYVLNPGPIVLHDYLVLGPMSKHVIVGLVALFVVLFGQALGLLFGIMFFGLLVIGVHGLLRDHTVY